MHNPNQAKPSAAANGDIPVGKIVLAGLGLAILLIAVLAGGRIALPKMEAAQTTAADPAAVVVPLPMSEPPLLVDEPLHWKEQLAIQRSQIEGYAWVDQKAGVVRIPVERAMALVAERGLPARGAAAPASKAASPSGAHP